MSRAGNLQLYFFVEIHRYGTFVGLCTATFAYMEHLILFTNGEFHNRHLRTETFDHSPLHVGRSVVTLVKIDMKHRCI